MKAPIVSDLHLEFGHGDLSLNPQDADVIILAGDISVGVQAAIEAEKIQVKYNRPVIFIAGNHEFYNKKVHSETLTTLRTTVQNNPNIVFLENNEVILTFQDEIVRFLGCTLWTDWELYGEAKKIYTKIGARTVMNDYRLTAQFTPEYSEILHNQSRIWLTKQLDPPHTLKTVVITHHLPSEKSIPLQYRDHELNPAYASHLDSLIAVSNVSIWVHGHTHNSCDYKVGGTRIVCNPRGYYPHNLNPNFDPGFIIEV